MLIRQSYTITPGASSIPNACASSKSAIASNC